MKNTCSEGFCHNVGRFQWSSTQCVVCFSTMFTASVTLEARLPVKSIGRLILNYCATDTEKDLISCQWIKRIPILCLYNFINRSLPRPFPHECANPKLTAQARARPHTNVSQKRTHLLTLTLIHAWISNQKTCKVEVEVWDLISNFIPHVLMYVLIYPFWFSS